MPATGALIGTPASISASEEPQTDAIDEEPFDSVISETTRMVYGNVFHRRHHGEHAALGEAAVADFATLRAHHAAGFTDRVRAGSCSGTGSVPCTRRETASMIWPSRAVPSVATTIACVSPRVNSDEPWVRGSTPTFEAIGRTVSSARPSMRTLVSEHRVAHGLVFELAEFLRQVAGVPAVGFGAAGQRAQHVLLDRGDGVAALQLVAHLEGLAEAGRRRLPSARRSARRSWPEPVHVARLGAGFGDQLVDRVDRPSASRDGRTSRRRASRLPTASSASDSTISTALAVPATTSSSSESASSVAVGLSRYWPFL